MKKVLVTGFEPFDGDELNPSSVLLDWLKERTFDFEVYTAVLPVSFTSASEKLNAAIEKYNPSHVLLTGFAKNRTELTIERIGINWVDARIPDNDGYALKSQKIFQNSPDGLFSTLPIDQILNAANNAKCPTKISTSAGEYVCNHLLYTYLLHHKKVPGTFLHIPGADCHEIFFQGIGAIINCL